MAKILILGLVLLLIAISVFSIVASSYYYSPDENIKKDNSITKSEPAKADEIKIVQKTGCYDELGNSRGSGECIGVPQEKKQCYKQVETCSGTKTIAVDCYPEVEQVRGDGECLKVPQEKNVCYKQVESCSGMKTVSIDCYPGIDQESGYGECLNLPQERGQCYKVKEIKSCD